LDDKRDMTVTDPLSFIEKRTVLIVDDVVDNLTLMSGILKDHYQVRDARSGQQALPGLRATLDIDQLSPSSRDEAVANLVDLIAHIRRMD